MPNYKYRCESCDHAEVVSLPISSDPAMKEECPKCLSLMGRVITKPRVILERDTVGKWFKEQTGKELMGD